MKRADAHEAHTSFCAARKTSWWRQPSLHSGASRCFIPWGLSEKMKITEECTMAEYELVREIKNLCRNNQMRDVFFEEIQCDDPESYVRGLLKGKTVELSVENGGDGMVTVHATCDGLIQKFVFTPL